MKYYIILFLFFNLFSVLAQDRIIKKETDYDIDVNENIVVQGTKNDTLFYTSAGKPLKIAVKEVLAVKKNFRNRDSKYIYLTPSDERIYGINNGIVYFKSDYKFTTANPGIAMEAFLERFRVYDSIIFENKVGDVYIRNNITGKRKRVHKNIKIGISFKDDELSRKVRGTIHYVSKDSSQLIMDIGVRGEHHIYSFHNNDIKAIAMEAPLVFIVRNTLGLSAIASVFFAPSCFYFFKNKWYTNFDFKNWHLSK